MKRSRHLGVYHNYDNEKPYRVAIKRYVNDKPVYDNKGYFINEDTAAWVYNIHALCIFNTGAVINRFDADAEVEEEMAMYSHDKPWFIAMIETATALIEDPENDIKFNTHQ